MGKVLKGLVICYTDGFKHEFNEKIERWVKHNGGTISKQLSPQVTHLITSEVAWKRYTPLVRAARRQKIRIVNRHWLLDSLMPGSRKKADETKYYFEQCKLPSFRRIGSARAKVSNDNTTGSRDPERLAVLKAKQLDRKKSVFTSACQRRVRDMVTAGFHIYIDPEQIMYEINLERQDALDDTLERHTLQLFESNDMPTTYALFTHYMHSNQVDVVEEELVSRGSNWISTSSVFRGFFRQRTGRKWTDEKARCSLCRPLEQWTNDELFQWKNSNHRRECGLLLNDQTTPTTVQTDPINKDVITEYDLKDNTRDAHA